MSQIMLLSNPLRDLQVHTDSVQGKEKKQDAKPMNIKNIAYNIHINQVYFLQCQETFKKMLPLKIKAFCEADY